MGRIALRSYPASPGGALAATLAVRETGPVGAPKPRLLDRFRKPADRMFLTSLLTTRKVSVGATPAKCGIEIHRPTQPDNIVQER